LAATASRSVNARPPAGAPLPRPAGADADGWRGAAETFAALEAAGVSFAPWQLAQTPDAAVGAAVALGFPVVLKAVRPGLVHKSDAGGVRTGVAAEATVRETVADFERRLGPGATLLQKQVEPGVELVIGAVRDPQFGPVVLFGLGGVWVEILDDVALRVAPFDETEARGMLDELRAQALLDGARGRPPVDRAAVARLLAGVSAWIARAPWLASLDVNPIIAGGSGLVAVDARIRLTPEGS
jgi:acetyltransferase